MEIMHSTPQKTAVGTQFKKGAFLAVAALLATGLLALLMCTGCSSEPSKEDIDDLAHSYAQRMSELTWTCTQGKVDAVVEVKLNNSDLGFSLTVPAGEEISQTTDRLATIWKSGVEAEYRKTSNQLHAITYRGSTIKWSENGQAKTASDSNGDFRLDEPDQQQ